MLKVVAKHRNVGVSIVTVEKWPLTDFDSLAPGNDKRYCEVSLGRRESLDHFGIDGRDYWSS